MECVSCSQPFKTDAKSCGAHAGKLQDPGEHLRCSERLHRYGNRSARIPLNRKSFLFAALHRPKGRIETDFAGLRAGLADRAESERSLVSQLEALAASKQAEMERSISWRQQGYRHRAFMLVDSNEGMEYMDKARELLSSLSAAEASSFTRFDSETNASLSRAFAKTIIVNVCLLALTVLLFGLVRYHGQALEQEVTQSRQELALRDLQLEKLTFALSNQARSKTSAIENSARLLLENYGGFLPRQGHEYAEQIKEASAEMVRTPTRFSRQPRLQPRCEGSLATGC